MGMEGQEKLTEFVEKFSWEQVPDNVRRWARMAFFDTIGATLAGSGMEQVQKTAAALGIRLNQSVADGESGVTIWGYGYRAGGIFDGIFLNGVSAHSCEYNDLIFGQPGHPSAVLVPVVFGLGEKLHRSAKEVLEAYICGLEVFGRINSAWMPEHHERGFHSTGTAGIVSAAVAAGKLLKLSREELTHACSLAGTFACGLRGNLGYTGNSLHVGNAAFGGTRAACYARAGIRANPELLEMENGYFQAFGGRKDKWKEQMELLGSVSIFEKPGLLLKRYPVCYSAFGAIEAAEALIRKFQIREGEIEQIWCLTSPNHYQSLPSRWPDSIYGQRFCIPFCVCWILSGGSADVESFSGEHFQDPRLLKLRDKLVYDVDPLQAGRRDFGSTLVRIRLTDGAMPEHRSCLDPQDRVENWNEDVWKKKINHCCRDFLGREGIAGLWKEYYAFESIEDIAVWIRQRFCNSSGLMLIR